MSKLLYIRVFKDESDLKSGYSQYSSLISRFFVGFGMCLLPHSSSVNVQAGKSGVSLN
jgi:hypothetical protein